MANKVYLVLMTFVENSGDETMKTVVGVYSEIIPAQKIAIMLDNMQGMICDYFHYEWCKANVLEYDLDCLSYEHKKSFKEMIEHYKSEIPNMEKLLE